MSALLIVSNSLLPKPVHAPAISDDEDEVVRVSNQVAESSLNAKSVIIRAAVPSYGQRRGWKPTSQEDFGAFITHRQDWPIPNL